MSCAVWGGCQVAGASLLVALDISAWQNSSTKLLDIRPSASCVLHEKAGAVHLMNRLVKRGLSPWCSKAPTVRCIMELLFAAHCCQSLGK